MTTQISIKALNMRYGQQSVLHDVSLEIGAGQFVTIVGPSGCGKTTLLRAIAGFVTPSSGQIYFDQQPVGHLPPERRPTSLVFQNYALWPHKTVFENIAFGLEVRRTPQFEIIQRVAEMLALVGLTGMSTRYPSQLSGGQQQRVALARSLAIAPAILLLDEPLSNLDAQIRVHMRAELRDIQQRLGITAVYVTHDQEEALSIADRVIVMRAGVIEQADDPLTVYQQPASAFVAQFVGRSSLLSGTIDSFHDAMVRVRLNTHVGTSSACFGIPQEHWMGKELAQIGQSVTIAVKPEQVDIHTTAPQTNVNVLSGTIQQRQLLGAHYQITVTTPFGTYDTIMPITSQLHYAIPQRGQDTWLTFPAQHLLLYPNH